MFAQEFVRNAWLAGTAIALASGLVGHFVVLRAQVFAGDALSHVAFTGALAAGAAGIDIRIGLFLGTILIALLLGSLGDRSHADDVTIGVTFAAILGLGVYFLALFSAGTGGGNGLLGARTLFGSIFGLSVTDALIATAIAAGIIAVVLTIARPLLFASIDPAVAAARGVPVRVLGLLLLALLGATTAEATQAIGALLLLGLTGRSRRRRPTTHRQPLPRAGPVRRDRCALHLGRSDHQLPNPETTAQLGDHRRRHRQLPARLSGHQRPTPRSHARTADRDPRNRELD